MTDEQIIQALECCVSDDKGIHEACRNCPLQEIRGNGERFYCPEYIRASALGIINRQQAEIERLTAENKRFADIGKMYSEIRAEAIKEFWDKAKQTREFRTCPYVYITDGDNLVKEMTEPVKIEHNSLCETETYMGE